ncbi:MAG TPA: Na+/H+ antiporter NhaA [Xanthomonadaceae bacterium]|nr:Na+/H+ antiporter NhaA [Xanthomonadaceae bacterium]
MTRRHRAHRKGTIVALPRPAAAAVEAMQRFLHLEASGGILLIGAALVALVMANTPLEEFYDHFRELPVQVQVGDFGIAKPLLLWINDGLMAIFFLLVSLEIKREAMSGQLSSRAQVMLPVICAFAGVLVPALVYAGFNSGDGAAMRGWAIPTATDIAFALGVLSLLGSRVPLGMKVLLSTIAVVDDLVAILIIAVFYSHGLSVGALAWAGLALAVMFALNRRGVTALTPYLLLGAFLWLCVLKSGVHATLAGVATGLLIPHARRSDADGDGVADDSDQTPLEELEHALHPWVAYLILPLFALANAGLALGDFTRDDLASAVPLGIAAGLVLGKPVGIVGAAFTARALGIARFPDGMDWKAMLGLGLLCGIGFTMSLFIAGLAFGGAGAEFAGSVLGVLMASTVAAVVGYAWLRVVLPARPTQDG